jgi:hypothetical protein
MLMVYELRSPPIREKLDDSSKPLICGDKDLLQLEINWQKTHVFCHPIKERHFNKRIKITQKLHTTKAPDFELQQHPPPNQTLLHPAAQNFPPPGQ